MQADARITLYGGTGIGIGMIGLGLLLGNTLIAITGVAMMAAALLVAFVFDHLAYESDSGEREREQSA